VSQRKNATEIARSPQVVGTIHSPGSLRKALRLRKGAVDFLEVRVDHFIDDLDLLRRAMPQLQLPYIVTVRHAGEGGAHPLSFAARKDLYREFTPGAAWLDLEIRSAGQLRGTIAEAHAAGVRLILSDHYFRSTPPLVRLAGRTKLAAAAGADLCKIAALTRGPAELGRLLALFSRSGKLPLSVMGMGAFGKVSRLLLAHAGSVLNYGYLDEPQVSGQWEATLLKQRLAELVS
jgi:3-dehydroquinate dehydratase-1